MSQSDRQTFPAENRIKNRQDYISVQSRGLRLRTPHFYVYILENQSSASRLGITVSRKVGNAVVRNRVKRLLREYYRQHINLMPSGHDISIIARKGAGRLAYTEVVAELSILFNNRSNQVSP